MLYVFAMKKLFRAIFVAAILSSGLIGSVSQMSTGGQQDVLASQIKYSFVSARWPAKEEVDAANKNLGSFEGVFGKVFIVRMRFSNESQSNVEYLAHRVGTIKPVGHKLYRGIGDPDWKGRASSITRMLPLGPEYDEGNFRWLILSPKDAVEFEIFMNPLGEEYSFSAFLRLNPNTRPIEILSEGFNKPKSR